MFDELFPIERATSLSQSVQRPYQAPEAPGVFKGFGSALADSLPHAANTTASAWSAILDAYGKAAAYRDAPTVAMIHGQPAPDLDKLKHETIDQMGNSPVALGFRERAKDFAPDPAAVGLAGQITHGVLTSLAKAGAYATTGPAAPVMFGADVGINRAQVLSDQGVDGGTAATAGVISGVAGAVGMRLPAALGATRMQSAAIGATLNPALTVAEIGSVQTLLQHADYEKIAAQYQPFDPVNLAISAVTGGAFGAAFHKGAAKGPHLTPEEHAAALTMHEVRARDADTLTRPGDVAANSAAHEAQILARQQLDSGEPVSVAQRVAAEQAQLDAAYQRVLDSPAGDAFDPLVHLQPEDIEGVVISRGGWHGRGDVEIKGAGLVKFIWKHGEQSNKAPEFQVSRSDILAFPQIIRDFEPLRPASEDGMRGREWRVQLPDETGAPRTVVYADNLINGQQGRHLVTVHVQEPGKIGSDAPHSLKKETDVGPESSGLMLESRAGDTAPSVLHSAGQETSVNSTIAHEFPPGTTMEQFAQGATERSMQAINAERAEMQRIANGELTPDQARTPLYQRMTPDEAHDRLTQLAAMERELPQRLDPANPVMQHAYDLWQRQTQAAKVGAGDTAKVSPRDTAQPATPEQARAQDMAARNPDAIIRMEDGSDVRMADLLALADDMEAQAKTETAAFGAAVNCALRFPQ